jgi:hypothetical protein
MFKTSAQVVFGISIFMTALSQEHLLKNAKTIICKFPEGVSGFVEKNIYDIKLSKDPVGSEEAPIKWLASVRRSN